MEDSPGSDAVQLRVRKVEVVDPDRQIGRHAEFCWDWSATGAPLERVVGRAAGERGQPTQLSSPSHSTRTHPDLDSYERLATSQDVDPRCAPRSIHRDSDSDSTSSADRGADAADRGRQAH